jgi:hypothetical protein
MKQWNRRLFEIATSRDQTEAGWVTFGTFMVSGSRLHLNFQETASDVVNQTCLIARLFCHALVAHMPDEALSEMCDSAANIYEFYNHPPSKSPLLPPALRGQARVGSVREAPAFEIAED